MTIDRTAQAALVDALRHIAEVRAGLSDRSLPPEAVKRVQDYIDIAIAGLDAKDRRIAELEAACQSVRSGAAEAVAAHDAQVARIAELESEAAKEAEATHQLAEEHEKQGMDLAFHRRGHNDALATIDDLQLRLSIATESNVNDRKRIAELEAGLREALDWWAPADGDVVAMGVWFKLSKLCLYEETRNQEVEDCELSDLLPSEET